MHEWSHQHLHTPTPPWNKLCYPCCLTWTRLSVVADAVNYVMGDFRVLWNRQHVVTGAGDGVPDQKHAVPLPLQQRHSLLPGQPTPVPTATVLRVKISGHDNHFKAEALPGLPFSPSRDPAAKPSTHTKTLAPRARLVNRRHPWLAVWASIRWHRTSTTKWNGLLLGLGAKYMSIAWNITSLGCGIPAEIQRPMITKFKNWNGGYGKTKKDPTNRMWRRNYVPQTHERQAAVKLVRI